MKKISLPDRGQPLDVTYMYQIADTINEISNDISNAKYNYTTVSVRGYEDQVIQTRAAKIVAGFVDITNNESVTAGTTTILSTGASSVAPKLRAVNATASCIKILTDTWIVAGDIA